MNIQMLSDTKEVVNLGQQWDCSASITKTENMILSIHLQASEEHLCENQPSCTEISKKSPNTHISALQKIDQFGRNR